MTKKIDGLRVVPIDTPNLNDVPAMLRRLADKIERGEKPALLQAVLVGTVAGTGETEVWSWGECPNVQQAVGLLHWGIDRLVHL
jgi:hypothetical protein